jgi:hypothetical protein
MESIVSNERNHDSDKGKCQEGPHEMTLISNNNSLESMAGDNDEVDHGLT